ncbi:serine O-acetyltransferase [Aquabacterium sp.]|uniref:serine O-acetyltransferase n=1 Tax=Aquabacterium sp. TaxID=1872578 RepID=UPI0035C71B62
MKRDDPGLHAIPLLDTEDGPVADVAASPSTAPGWWRLLKEDVACVLTRDPAARNLFEVWTIYPGVQAVALYRLAHALWRRGARYGARLLSFIARWLTNVDIHPGARIGRRFFIDHGACVVIGETAEIGDDVTLYHGVTLGGTTWQPGKRHPTLGHGVVVGAGAKILGPITVGHGARVAANSVVIDNVPDAATVVGIPGRIVIRREPRQASDRIDLQHHLIPDPVGKAIGCLLDRIAELESEVKLLKGQAAPTHTGDDACHSCEVDGHPCAQPTFASRSGVSS